MSDANVEAILKILINSGGDVSYFDSFLYARLWQISGKTLPTEPSQHYDGCSTDDHFKILDDGEITEEKQNLFDFHIEELPYKDTYNEFTSSADVMANDKDTRTKSRLRSKLM